MIPLWKLTGRTGNQMFQFAYLYSQVRDGVIPDFYLQGEEYFEKYKDEIKQMFGSGISSIDKVSIHVRRGDYVNNPFYVDLCETDYYEKAIALFPSSSFLVFSDDIEWCKGRFKGGEFEFFHGTEIEDLNMMASCKHNIIANSSFSWWGAYLNPNPGKTIIAPEKWYADGQKRTSCPQGWILL